jgi:hypothetical protein
VGVLGQVRAAGDLWSSGFIRSGQAGGTLTLRNALGSVTLLLQGSPEPGFGPLPLLFQFSVERGTGAYTGLEMSGTAFLQLRFNGHHVGPTGHGTFALTLQPNITPPPPGLQTGIEGVAMVGPISPISVPGVPNSRPLPGAIIDVEPPTGGAVIAQARTDDSGRFQLSLPPGTYLLVPLPPTPGRPFPRGTPETVTVPPGGFAQVVVNYFSGIE